MNKQVETILQASLLDRQEAAAQPETPACASIIQEAWKIFTCSWKAKAAG